MAFFYFDESIHSGAGFILGGFVCFRNDPSEMIREALIKAGIRPGIDEFKSGSRMDMNPAQARAREELEQVIGQCKVAVVVGPVDCRAEFGFEALRGLKKIISSNGLTPVDHQVFLDQGFVRNRRGFDQLAAKLELGDCSLNIEQDSVQILGLQVADLVAHTCATMLLAQIGLVNKQVKAGENSGYDSDDDIDLTFLLWAGLRWNFFAAPPLPPDQWKSELDWQVDVASRGLYIADSCAPTLRGAALERFGKMYLGCIH